jgi:hypothetical protein
MSESTETAVAATDETGSMLMVITLKSGVQIRVDVDQYTVQEYRTGELAGLKWEATENTTAAPKWLDVTEVAAVHTEWPKPGWLRREVDEAT